MTRGRRRILVGVAVAVPAAAGVVVAFVSGGEAEIEAEQTILQQERIHYAAIHGLSA